MYPEYIQFCSDQLKCRYRTKPNSSSQVKKGSQPSRPETKGPREKITINVSGCKFQTWRSTLCKHPGTLLGSADALRRFYDWSRKEYFLDRDPNIFRHVLSYYQVGKLHLSHNDCLATFYDELDFYGIPNHMLHECCWNNCQEMSEKIMKNKALKADENNEVVIPTNFNKIRKGIIYNTILISSVGFWLAEKACINPVYVLHGVLRKYNTMVLSS